MKIACLLLTMACAVGAAHAQEFLDCHSVPGWEQTGPKRQYSADNLYDYKDGGAEGYLVYGFTHMQGVDCTSAGSTMAIDVSEMSDADSAYGMFAANRDPNLPIAKIGMGGQVQPQSLSFAKGKYFVELVMTDAKPDGNYTAALEAFAAKMQARLEGRETPPEALGWFSSVDQTSARMVPESVLGLRMLKRGYVAKYKQGQAFIVLEETPESAAALMKKLRERFEGAVPAQIGDEAFQAKAPYLDGICVFRKGRILAGYANLPGPQEAAAQSAQLATRIP